MFRPVLQNKLTIYVFSFHHLELFCFYFWWNCIHDLGDCNENLKDVVRQNAQIIVLWLSETKHCLMPENNKRFFSGLPYELHIRFRYIINIRDCNEAGMKCDLFNVTIRKEKVTLVFFAFANAGFGNCTSKNEHLKKTTKILYMCISSILMFTMQMNRIHIIIHQSYFIYYTSMKSEERNNGQATNLRPFVQNDSNIKQLESLRHRKWLCKQ